MVVMVEETQFLPAQALPSALFWLLIPGGAESSPEAQLWKAEAEAVQPPRLPRPSHPHTIFLQTVFIF